MKKSPSVLKTIAFSTAAVLATSLGTNACGLGGLDSYKNNNGILEDGITFEKNGTAIAGREFGNGWLDLSCNKAGDVVVKIVSPNWRVEREGSFKDTACKDGKLTVGELSSNDIPEPLRN